MQITNFKSFVKYLWNAVAAGSQATKDAAGLTEAASSTAIAKPSSELALVRVEAAETKSVAELTEERWRKVGFAEARQTKVQKPDAAAERGLLDRAEKMARASVPPSFEPARYAADRRTEGALAAHEAELEESAEPIQMAAAQLRLREEERARLGQEGPVPVASDELRWTAAMGVTFSFAPTIHDFFGAMFGPLKWLLAIGFGACFGLLLVHAILPTNDAAETGDRSGLGAVGASIAVGLGFFVVRIASARHLPDYVFAFGMACVEIGIVLFLDYKARELCGQRTKWRSKREAIEVADALVAVAAAEYGRRADRQEAIKAEIARIVASELKGRVWTTQEDLAAVAVAAVLDGYRAGVRANRAHGIVPPEVL